MTEALMKNFFAAADSLDVDRFCGALPSNIKWRFANFPEANGIADVRAQYELIVGVAKKMHHDIIGIWRDGNCVTGETRVHYTDHHGREFSYPGCDIIFLDGDTIREVRIFVDNHEMFIPPQGEGGGAAGGGQ